MTIPVFNSPQWKWARAETKQSYGGINNVVDIEPEKGRAYKVVVDIPTEFIHYITTAGGYTRGLDITFFLEQVEKRWYFGYQIESREHVDLWYYTNSTLPSWTYKN